MGARSPVVLHDSGEVAMGNSLMATEKEVVINEAELRTTCQVIMIIVAALRQVAPSALFINHRFRRIKSHSVSGCVGDESGLSVCGAGQRHLGFSSPDGFIWGDGCVLVQGGRPFFFRVSRVRWLVPLVRPAAAVRVCVVHPCFWCRVRHHLLFEGEGRRTWLVLEYDLMMG